MTGFYFCERTFWSESSCNKNNDFKPSSVNKVYFMCSRELQVELGADQRQKLLWSSIFHPQHILLFYLWLQNVQWWAQIYTHRNSRTLSARRRCFCRLPFEKTHIMLMQSLFVFCRVASALIHRDSETTKEWDEMSCGSKWFYMHFCESEGLQLYMHLGSNWKKLIKFDIVLSSFAFTQSWVSFLTGVHCWRGPDGCCIAPF